jgi:hypothetical protein
MLQDRPFLLTRHCSRRLRAPDPIRDEDALDAQHQAIICSMSKIITWLFW